MNRFQRVVAATALGAAVVAPATPAFAEPYSWHGSDSAPAAIKSKAQIEYEEGLRLQQESGTGNTASDTSVTPEAASFPWETLGLAALGAGALAAGGVVLVRRSNRELSRA
jgi:hypothetical protein